MSSAVEPKPLDYKPPEKVGTSPARPALRATVTPVVTGPTAVPPAPKTAHEVMALHSAFGNSAVARAASTGPLVTAAAPVQPSPVSPLVSPARDSGAREQAAPPAAVAPVGGKTVARGAAAPPATSARTAANGSGPKSPSGATGQARGEAKTEPASASSAGAQKGPSSAGGTASAHADPAFAAVIHRVKAVAHHQKTHGPAGVAAAAGHAAAVSPANEVPSRAAAKQTDAMDRQQPKPFNRETFKQALRAKIKGTAPTTLKAADEFKKNNKLSAVKSDLNAEVGKEKTASQGPVADKVAETPNTSGIEPKPTTPLPAQDAGPAPDVAAAGAAPKPATNADVSLEAGPQQLDRQMADAKVTEDQLQKSNEPAFQSALNQKKDAEKESVTAPQAYRKQEAVLLHTAQSEAQIAATRHAAEMHGSRKHSLSSVAAHQAEVKAEEEKHRAQIASDIDKIYLSTKQSVEARLQKLDKDVNETFDKGATGAQKKFEDHVGDRMFDYKLKRYLGPGGSILWAKDQLLDLPDEVNAFYQEGHDLYVSEMDGVIDQVATMVETGLNEAKAAIAAGRAQIQTYIGSLSPAFQEMGKKAAAGIQGKFDSLEQSVVAKQDQLVDSLAKKYNDNLQKVNERIEQMKEENRGLVHQAAEAIKGVIQTIIDLKNMLIQVFARASDAVGLVIADPMGFLGHLVDAGKLGFSNFADHIVEHLKQGFMDWLFGAVASTGIQLPKSFDLPGILSLVLQILGLTYSNIRSRAVKILGEKVVKALETAAEIFKILITKGPAGLWEYIKEKIGDLKTMVIEKIKSFVMEKVIIAGITWLIGLLNPASAFVKACKAIYDIVMFFVERGKQILDLVNAIIDSITAIAKGAIGPAANFVEASLARTIPVIIGFLASLLGVGGISEKIKEIIEAIRKPINDAIDWVITKAVALVKAVGGLLGFGKEKEEKRDSGKPEGVKGMVQDAIQERLDGDVSETKAEKVLPEILQQFLPMGLKSLTLGQPNAEGTREIQAEASPKTTIAQLIAKKVTVGVSATVHFREDDDKSVLEGITRGPKHPNEEAPISFFKKIDPSTWQAIEGASPLTEEKQAILKKMGGTGNVAMLPTVGNLKNFQPEAGYVVEPKAGSRKLEILSWNSSAPVRGDNLSHAEKQALEFLEGRPATWLKRVKEIKLVIAGKAICPKCKEDLEKSEKFFRERDITLDWEPRKAPTTDEQFQVKK